MSGKPVAARTGKRELNKQDKLRRITDAARKLFIANGYDEASTRQIAVRAGVALGTLFLYAANKRDLLFLVVNEELEEVAAKAASAIRPDVTLIQNLIRAFRPLYEFFGKDPGLSRLTLREMTFYESGLQAKRFIRIRQTMIELCKEMVRIAQRRNEIRTGSRYRRAGEVLFAIFQIELRKWLAGANRPKVDPGLRDLEEALEIVIAGLSTRGT
jgi:AcrR family transcriptional regulator